MKRTIFEILCDSCGEKETGYRTMDWLVKHLILYKGWEVTKTKQFCASCVEESPAVPIQLGILVK